MLIGVVEQTATILRQGVYSVVTFSSIGLLLGHRFERTTVPRHGRVNPESSQGSRLLDHPMSLDQWIDNVPAGHTAPSFHPHRNTALLYVDQVIDNHEAVTSGAFHTNLLYYR